jgi:hypothetical protein
MVAIANHREFFLVDVSLRELKKRQEPIFFISMSFYLFVHQPHTTRCMVSRPVLLSASIAIQTIENTLAELDPYNHQFPDPDDYRSLRDCEFPDDIEDPLELIRILHGDVFTKQLEYEDSLEHIVSVLSDCLQQELARRGLRADQLYDSSDDDNDTDGNVDRWTNDQVVAQAEEPAFSSSFAPTASGACSTA